MSDATTLRPTRKDGLARLNAFVPGMGRAYAARRNFDHGAGAHCDVSMLSPYTRRRLVRERELVEAALSAHSLSACEKFVQEVFWRSYWKGWLEGRPAVWRHYRDGLAQDRALVADDVHLAERIAAAEAGKTGIECFDVWARELVETGYMHNHARMWFASIWIFTLCLPWRLGADFFLRHLLDGDPASNTLSWRWVAGLHTRGKTYEAREWNVAKFTSGRLSPAPGTFAEGVGPLEESCDPGPHRPHRRVSHPAPNHPTLLVVTDDDCQPETLGLPLERLTGCAAFCLSERRSDAPVSPLVRDFDLGALADAVERVTSAGGPPATLHEYPSADALIEVAERCGATQIVTAYLPVGPARDWVDAARPKLNKAGVSLAEVLRPWDAAVWPHASAGFFKLRKRIPALLREAVQPEFDLLR